MTNTLATAGQFIGAVLGAGTVGGLLSSELTRWFTVRENRRQHLSRLLTELLEVRRISVQTSHITKLIAVLIPAELDFGTVIQQVQGLVVNPQKLHERYEAAVNELSSLDPLLAYRLRASDLLPAMTKVISQIPVNNPLAAEVCRDIAEIAGESCNPALDDAVLRVAGELGSKVLRETKAILAKQLETPQGGKKLLDLLQDKIPELIAFDAAESAGRTL
jgi:hypothetical protein